MKRSLTAALALIATVCGVSVARADLDSLLGDWAAAASRDAGSPTATDSSTGVLLAPASEGLTALDAELAEGMISVPQPAEKRASQSGPNETLTANQLQQAPLTPAHPLPDELVAIPSPTTDGYSVISPTVNPYCEDSPVNHDSQCSSGTCDSSCGCGKLIPRNQVCHQLGESECRPHRAPVLPPPSNLLQMFRSKNSYSGIWAGYADETRARLRNTSPHINGTWRTCDHGGLIEPACNACVPSSDD